MKKSIIALVAVSLSALIIGLTGCGPKNAPKSIIDEAQKIQEPEDRELVVAALSDFLESEVVGPFFDSSYGCAIFPSVGKGGLGIGAASGGGWIFREGDLVAITRMTQVTIGFQAGGQLFSQIIFFENAEAYGAFAKGDFEFGAQASAVAITAGASASTGTQGGGTSGAGSAQSKTEYTDGMAIFTRAKGGLMYEASIGGQKFSYTELEM
ncbi:MAG: hypothetical protein DRP71_04015 [Verrucomicrobia bacterium]|nr:MAG: hypothetical protein DRP71_04015 [Verrucomicrobiota bacterium]